MSEDKKKLMRSRDERMIAGVCGGIAEYFEIDPTVIRLAFILGTLLGGPGLIAYIVCLILMPLEPEAQFASTQLTDQPEEDSA
jgi:phage shock protein C